MAGVRGSKLPRVPRQRKTGKYRAVRTTIDGITFASKKEAARYAQLKLLQTAGRIRNLELQPRYTLEVNGRKVCEYRADFRYEMYTATHHWLKRVEDVKGFRTRDYLLKKKLMLAIHGIEVFET